MIIYLGADHRGFALKEHIKKFLEREGYELADCGNTERDAEDDYPDFASLVATVVAKDPAARRGILACGSGVGVDVTANKFAGIRSVLAFSPEEVRLARADDDVNILSLPADFIDNHDAEKMVEIFLRTPFKGEVKYKRRINKIKKIETKTS